MLNEAAILRGSLEALRPMRAQGVEVIVVDGGSVDATAELVPPWVDGFIESSRGRARQMNAGAALARGEILLFLHADTFLPADALGALRAFHGLENSVWGRFDVELSAVASFRQGRQLRVIERLVNLRSRLSGVATGDQGIFVRRAWFERVGGYPDIELMEDVALSKRLRRHQWPRCISTRVRTSSRRWEHKGIWRTVVLMWWLRLAFWAGADPKRLASMYYPKN